MRDINNTCRPTSNLYHYICAGKYQGINDANKLNTLMKTCSQYEYEHRYYSQAWIKDNNMYKYMEKYRQETQITKTGNCTVPVCHSFPFFLGR